MISRLIVDRNVEHTDLLQSEDLCGQSKCKPEILHDKIKGDFINPSFRVSLTFIFSF